METETPIMLAMRLGCATEERVGPMLDRVTEVRELLVVLRARLLRE